MLHPVKVKQMSDLTFDWGACHEGLPGHPVNPKTDLNSIFLLMVNMPASGFEMALNDDTFSTIFARHPGPAAQLHADERRDVQVAVQQLRDG